MEPHVQLAVGTNPVKTSPRTACSSDHTDFDHGGLASATKFSELVIAGYVV